MSISKKKKNFLGELAELIARYEIPAAVIIYHFEDSTNNSAVVDSCATEEMRDGYNMLSDQIAEYLHYKFSN